MHSCLKRNWEDIIPFCGAINSPVLYSGDVCVWKPGWIQSQGVDSLPCMLRHLHAMESFKFTSGATPANLDNCNTIFTVAVLFVPQCKDKHGECLKYEACRDSGRLHSRANCRLGEELRAYPARGYLYNSMVNSLHLSLGSWCVAMTLGSNWPYVY